MNEKREKILAELFEKIPKSLLMKFVVIDSTKNRVIYSGRQDWNKITVYISLSENKIDFFPEHTLSKLTNCKGVTITSFIDGVNKRPNLPDMRTPKIDFAEIDD